MFLFQLSMGALNEGGASIKRSKGLMLASTFPRALLPITTVYKLYRKFVFAGCVFAVVFILVGGRPGPGFFLLPLVFVLQMVMNTGIALLVSTYVTLVADGSNVIAYVARILFFATPVIYPANILPPGAKVLIAWQPLFALFSSYQTILAGGTPSFSLLLQTAFWAFALLIGGAWVFLRRERDFTMRL
jgi:ABC-type polysaccharide/polyol phosphate export permease